jgi:hypothetical protein
MREIRALGKVSKITTSEICGNQVDGDVSSNFHILLKWDTADPNQPYLLDDTTGIYIPVSICG